MDTTTNAPIHDLTTLKESTMRNNAKLTKATRKQINGGGRPSKFNAAMCAEAKKLCRLGFTDAELADFFWVSEQTVNTWKRRHQEFLESLKRVKAIADAEVATSLYRRALGYSHPAVKIFADVKTGLVEQVPRNSGALRQEGRRNTTHPTPWPAFSASRTGRRASGATRLSRKSAAAPTAARSR